MRELFELALVIGKRIAAECSDENAQALLMQIERLVSALPTQDPPIQGAILEISETPPPIINNTLTLRLNKVAVSDSETVYDPEVGVNTGVLDVAA